MKTRSMEQKNNLMHMIAFKIENKIYYNFDKIKFTTIITADDINLVYAIVDGLTGSFIMDRLNGYCSIQDMLN